jgi:hypothetical protein
MLEQPSRARIAQARKIAARSERYLVGIGRGAAIGRIVTPRLSAYCSAIAQLQRSTLPIDAAPAIDSASFSRGFLDRGLFDACLLRPPQPTRRAMGRHPTTLNDSRLLVPTQISLSIPDLRGSARSPITTSDRGWRVNRIVRSQKATVDNDFK